MFNWLATSFNIILYKPLFNLLVFLYNTIPGHDFGIAIIVLTIIIKVILYPLSVKAVRSQAVLQALQPKIKEIQVKYKDDKERQAREMLAIYKQEKINPFSGLLITFIQLPILIALYQVFWNGLKSSSSFSLYKFVANPISINFIFLHIIDLSKPNFYFAILAGVVQYFQAKMMIPKSEKNNEKKTKESEFTDMMQKQMTYFLPFFTVIILLGLPSALGLYWIIGGILSIIQQKIILNKKT